MKRIKKWLTILPILVVTAILGLSPVAAMAADEDIAAIELEKHDGDIAETIIALNEKK